MAATASDRRFRRFPVTGTVRLYSGSEMWTTTLVDLSMRGALLVRPPEWTALIAERFRLDVRLDGGLMIAMVVKLVRVDEGELAFSCTRIDIDSFSRLKRLVELNLGNTESMNRELADLCEA
jgi:hypothetical protein